MNQKAKMPRLFVIISRDLYRHKREWIVSEWCAKISPQILYRNVICGRVVNGHSQKTGTQSETLWNKIIWKCNKVYLSVCWLGEMNPNTDKNGLNFYMSNPIELWFLWVSVHSHHYVATRTPLNESKSCDIWTKEGKFSQVRYVYIDI